MGDQYDYLPRAPKSLAML